MTSGAALGVDGPAPHRSPSVTAISTFARWDLAGALMGTAFVVIANGVFVREPLVWVVLPFLLVLDTCLFLALRAIEDGHVARSLALITLGNWVIAAVVSPLFPMLWPVMGLTVIMPVVLATPHLHLSQIRVLIFGAVIAAAFVSAGGLLNDDGGVVKDVDDNLEFVLVVGALAAHVVPIALIVAQNNRLQQDALDEVYGLNFNLARSEEALTASRRRVAQAADDERSRIERDLHDGAQQRLVALGVRLRLLQSQTADDPNTSATVSGLVDELGEAIEELRELAHGIYPPLLETRGLPDALQAVGRRSPTPINLDVSGLSNGHSTRFDRTVETTLYFTGLEAITNATKHAPDATISVTLTEDDGDLTLVVADDGPGFDAELTSDPGGTLNMSDRMAAVNGRLNIQSTPGEGTTVTATIAGATPIGDAP